MSSLDPDQDLHFNWADLGLNSMARLSADINRPLVKCLSTEK